MSQTRRNQSKGALLIGAGIAIGVMSGGLLGGYLVLSEPQEQNTVAVPAGSGGANSASAKEAVAEYSLASPNDLVTVEISGQSTQATWRDIGAKQGKTLDREVAEAYLKTLIERYDKAPRDARLDLEARKIIPEQSGQVIDRYASLSAFDIAWKRGRKRVLLPTVAVPADVDVKGLGIDNISDVLATFRTKFTIKEKFRSDNLKIAASRLNGYVLQPGVEFSFNEVVGARTEREGYKIAHVIQAGEMVDGLAGGTCQISTTLHGAAFFAGIGIVSSTPHSRPSTYAEMGLDATVVYPTTDLKLRNDFEFPVVIHFRVARGASVVEILGRSRPYDEVAFERNIRSQISFNTVTREDENLPVGSMVVDQAGFPGYNLTRYRKLYKDGQVVKTDKWTLQYRPVTEYARLGINPDPNLVPPKTKKRKGLRTPRSSQMRIVR